MSVFDLSPDDSKVAKGGAILLLLWHHLFYRHPEYGWFVYYTSGQATVCVAMFLILSGYGLAKVFKPEQNVFHFYYKRLSKLYSTYWFIFLVCVPISMMLLDVTVKSAFSSVRHPYLATFAQFLGMQVYYGGHGFNPTWWFMSAIIPLYILFPFFYLAIDKYSWWALLVCLICTAFPKVDIPVLQQWIFPFVLGIFLAKWQVPPNNQWNKSISSLPKLIAVLAVLITLSFVVEIYGGPFGLTAQFLRNVLIAPLAISFFVCLSKVHWIITRILRIFGEYSYVIFLTHTFLYFLWFPKLFYLLKTPPLIMIVLTISSLLFAISLTKLQLALTTIYKLILRRFEKKFNDTHSCHHFCIFFGFQNFSIC